MNLESAETIKCDPWIEEVERSIEHVFKIISGEVPSKAGSDESLKTPSIESSITVSGAIERRVSVTLDAVAAVAWASDLVGEEVGGLNDLVYDSIGELANMIAGTAKSRSSVSDQPGSQSSQLGLPKVTLDPALPDHCSEEEVWSFRYGGGLVRITSRPSGPQ